MVKFPLLCITLIKFVFFQKWEYNIEASFLEIYNETIRDLLVSPSEAKSLSYDIKATDGRSPHTHVTNLKVSSALSARNGLEFDYLGYH